MICVNKNNLAYLYFFVPIVFLLYLFSIIEVCAYQEERTVAITDLGSFTDTMGIKNIVGTVENKNDVPVQMLIGLNTTSSNNTVSLLVAEPYGKIIYPYREAPFKSRFFPLLM